MESTDKAVDARKITVALENASDHEVLVRLLVSSSTPHSLTDLTHCT